jgi:hypothetical protein
MPFSGGDRVVALYDDGKWYRGKVVTISEEHRLSIDFDDGDKLLNVVEDDAKLKPAIGPPLEPARYFSEGTQRPGLDGRTWVVETTWEQCRHYKGKLVGGIEVNSWRATTTDQVPVKRQRTFAASKMDKVPRGCKQLEMLQDFLLAGPKDSAANVCLPKSGEGHPRAEPAAPEGEGGDTATSNEDEPVAPEAPVAREQVGEPEEPSTPPAGAKAATALVPFGGINEVRSLLARFHLEQYTDKFEELGYDDCKFLRHLRMEDQESLSDILIKEVGMKAGHAAKLLQWWSGDSD